MIGSLTTKLENRGLTFVFYLATTNLLLLFILLFILAANLAPALADDPPPVTELWVGEMTQRTPIPWKGKMELFIRYSSGAADPRPFEGIITWPTLGSARTKVKGEKTWERITFKETECIDGGCAKVTLGGDYHGNFNPAYDELRGTGGIQAFGFSGSFVLKRVIVDE